jgi:superfamily II DNA/RNA helicase
LSFNQFRLSSDILKGLQDTKIESPSPLQKKIFKAVQEKKDLVINTTIEENPEVGYLISLFNELTKSERRQGTRAIILAGNKERAKKLDEWIWAIGYHASIESACFTTDGNEEEQISALTAGPVVIVATPDRLSSILGKGRLVFREVSQLIVDQAELIDDWEAVEVISKRILGNCQKIFTAAKDSKELRDAEKHLLQDPELVTLAKKPEAKAEKKADEVSIKKGLTQYYINVPPRSKITTLMNHLDNHSADSVVIFTASRKTADRLYKILRKSDKRAVSVHSQLESDTFKERFERFTSNNVQNLLVGEMSAADLPLEQATQVINYDVPEDVDEYKLRADLVGDGKATRMISLVSKQDREDIDTICNSLGFAPEEIPLPKAVKQKVSSQDKPKLKGKSSPKSTPQSSSKKKQPKKGGKKKREVPPKGKMNIHELPRPTYDQLEGGRAGKPKKKGLVGFIKNLFNS